MKDTPVPQLGSNLVPFASNRKPPASNRIPTVKNRRFYIDVSLFLSGSRANFSDSPFVSIHEPPRVVVVVGIWNRNPLVRCQNQRRTKSSGSSERTKKKWWKSVLWQYHTRTHKATHEIWCDTGSRARTHMHTFGHTRALLQGFPFQLTTINSLLAILDLKNTIVYHLQTSFWYTVHFNFTIVVFENTRQMRHGLFWFWLERVSLGCKNWTML